MFICLENFIAIYIKYFQQGSSDKLHCSKGIMTSDVLLKLIWKNKKFVCLAKIYNLSNSINEPKRIISADKGALMKRNKYSDDFSKLKYKRNLDKHFTVNNSWWMWV